MACGSGRFSVPISRRGVTVVADDLDMVPLRKLASKSGGIMAVRGDANMLPFKDGSFDCVVSIETIDYLEVGNVLKEYNRVLKDDAYLIINFSNKHSYKRYLHRLLSTHRTFYRYSFSDIARCLNYEGFEILSAQGYNWLPFKRGSNSRQIGLSEVLEDVFQLGRLPEINPWVTAAAKKR